MTRTPNQATTTATSVTDDTDGLASARSWVARQLRFEHMLGSLERRVVLTLDETANRKRP